MLYQRSGISLSLRRNFLVTAPSLLKSVRKVPRPERVALADCFWSPASVTSPRGVAADQFQTRTRTVRSPGGGFPAATLELHRPFDPMLLVGGGMERPRRVIKVSPPEGA